MRNVKRQIPKGLGPNSAPYTLRTFRPTRDAPIAKGRVYKPGNLRWLKEKAIHKMKGRLR